MQNVLIITPRPIAGHVIPLACRLRSAGYSVGETPLDGSGSDALDALLDQFAGRPPDLLLADLVSTVDCLPLRHVRRLLRHAWGEDVPLPPCLALFCPQHLDQPDWPAYTDDFLLPPYAPPEVVARVKLLLFRRRHIEVGNTLTFADIRLDLASGRALDAEQRVLPLTPREYELLQFLLTHRGKLFTRDRLLDLVWGVDFEGGARTVDIHIRRLRAKLPPTTAKLLTTQRGSGYGFQR